MYFQMKISQESRNRGKYRHLLCLVFSIILFCFVAGCNKDSTQETSIRGLTKKANHAPKTIQLKQEVIELPNSFPYRFSYYPQITEVLGGNSNGELVGFLWGSTNGMGVKKHEQLQALYTIDPTRNIANKIVEPRPGFKIFRAASDNKWLAWVERNEVAWKIYALNRTTKVIKMIDEGKYFKEAGPDYPSVALYNGILAYDSSVKNAKNEMVSRVIAQNLNNNKMLILSEIRGTEQYLGAPSIYGDYVVWHRGEWTKEMKAEVYIYNLTDHKRRRLSTTDSAITPVIWGKYIVWNSYSNKLPECKNIVLYNLETGSCKSITNATPSDKVEYFSPTIAHGIAIWNANLLPYKPAVYIAATGEKREFGVEGEQARVYGSWLIWRHREKGLGMLVSGLSSFFSVLDLTGLSSQKPITKPPFALDVPVTESKLAGLTPPEVVALYFQAEKEGRYDLVSSLLSDEPGLAGKREYLADMKRSQEEVISYAISRDYLIEGDKAYVGIIEMRIRQSNQTIMVDDKPGNFHLTQENGIWKLTQVARQ